MTSLIRRATGGLTILEALWLIYMNFATTPNAGFACTANGCLGPSFIPVYSQAALILVVALLIVGGLGVWGVSLAFLGGAILSAIVLLTMGYTALVTSGYPYLSPILDQAVAGAVLAFVATLGNAASMRSRRGLSEQANPMNLPVFG